MYSISDEYKIACKKLTRQSRSKVVIDNVTYDGSKYIKDYPKFSHSNETMIGGFPIKSAEFSLWIKEGFIDVINKEIKIYRGLVINEEVTWIPQGVFIAQNEDVTTSDTGEYITVKCYDKAKEAGTKTYVDNNAYPISESNYIKNVISQSGYELDENVFVESNYMMRQKPNMPVDTSVREIISRYAEQRGAIALFSRLGKIQIKRPTEIDLSYKFYEYKKLTCEKLYGPLNQVILGNKNINNNVVWPEGEQTFPWTINDNPFLDLIKLDRNQEIYNQVNNLELTPFALESALDVFFLDVNDIIAIEKKDKTIQKVTILSIETENRLKCKIGASVQNKSNIAYELAGSIKKDLELVRFDVDYNKNEINALVSKTETNSKKIDTLNPIKSVSGNPVFLQNSAGKDIPRLLIKGNSWQESGEKCNLITKQGFSTSLTDEDFWIKNTTTTTPFTPLTDGWGRFDVSSDYSSSLAFSMIKFENILLKPNTDYTVFVEIKNFDDLGTFMVGYGKAPFVEGGIGVGENGVTSGTYKYNVRTISDFSDISFLSIMFQFFNKSTVIDFRIMIIEGHHAEENLVYKPYFPSEASPEYPREIKTISGIVNNDGNWLPIKTLSTIKNLFNANTVAFEDGTNTDLQIENNNKIKLTNNGIWNRRIANLKLDPNTTYTISSDVENPNGLYCGLFENDNNFDIKNQTNFKSEIQITTANDGTLNLTFYSNWSGNTSTGSVIFNNIQVEKGSEATDYEPYKEEPSLVDLNQYDEEGHVVNHYELAKVGDVYDELEVASGNLIKKIGKIESYSNEEITTNYMSSTGILSSGATVYYVLKEEQHINLRYTKVSTFEDDCYIGIDDELIDFFDCDYYTKSKITEYFETQKDSEAKMQILSDSITQKVSEVTTTIKNNEIAFNEKLNDLATNESVEQQIHSVENKITSSEQKITVINEQLENGISKIRTEKGYTFNDQGLTIDDSNSKVQNKLAENGMTITDKSSNTTLLFAGYDNDSQETIVKARNMTVEKYLVAPNCRFEEYNNYNHGKGTGVFSL